MSVQCCRSERMTRGFIGGLSCLPITESLKAGEHQMRFRESVSVNNVEVQIKRRDQPETMDCYSSSSSSSIGIRSSIESECDDDDESEIQSSYRSGPFDSMEALEEVLPIRRGISRFYSGKSKSFTGLQNALTCSSMKEIAKPDNAYTRKRKNLIACTNILQGSHNKIGGISKKLKHTNQRKSIHDVGRSCESKSTCENDLDASFLFPPCRFSPLGLLEKAPFSQRNISGRRSFSLLDLQ